MPYTATYAWDINVQATGYKLYSGTATGVYTAVKDMGNVVQGTIIFPTEGDWYVALTAYNAGGESAFSAELFETILFPSRVRIVKTFR